MQLMQSSHDFILVIFDLKAVQHASSDCFKGRLPVAIADLELTGIKSPSWTGGRRQVFRL